MSGRCRNDDGQTPHHPAEIGGRLCRPCQELKETQMTEPTLMQETTRTTYRRWGWTDDDRIDLMEHVWTEPPDHGTYVTVVQIVNHPTNDDAYVGLNIIQLAREGETTGWLVSRRMAAERDRTVGELTAAVHRQIPSLRIVVLG